MYRCWNWRQLVAGNYKQQQNWGRLEEHLLHRLPRAPVSDSSWVRTEAYVPSIVGETEEGSWGTQM